VLLNKLFPFLKNRSIKVIDRRRREFLVPLLPATFYDEYIDILDEVAKNPTPQSMAAGRKRLRAIIKTVWPSKEWKQLLLFDYSDTAHIAGKLFFGISKRVIRHDDKASADGASGNINFEFITAKIVNKFPCYTFEALMQEPIPILLNLFKLANQVGKYNAWSELFLAHAAAQHGGKCLDDLEKATHALFSTDEIHMPVKYSEEEYQASLKRIEELKDKSPDFKITL
jgi:hypothetical protein